MSPALGKYHAAVSLVIFLLNGAAWIETTGQGTSGVGDPETMPESTR